MRLTPTQTLIHRKIIVSGLMFGVFFYAATSVSALSVRPYCGNGVLEAREECDTGSSNADKPNLCRTNCRNPYCGDRIIDRGEECDDGNRNGFDACNNGCFLTARKIPAVCGNGVLEDPEQCDDGNRFGRDGCSSQCQLENPPACGNGVLERGEECDDRNANDGDGCSAQCLVERGVCGDGKIQSALGETCDDGNTVDNDGCSHNCRKDAARTISSLGTVNSICGDGRLDSMNGEQCDAGPSNSIVPSQCRPNCELPFCGDGIKDNNEQCDDGNRLNDDGCDAFCDIESAVSQSSQVVTSVSSDTIQQAVSAPPQIVYSSAPVISNSQLTGIARHPGAPNYPVRTPQTGPEIPIIFASTLALLIGLWQNRRRPAQ